MQLKTKILIAEHDSSDLELLQRELISGGIDYTAEIVQNEKDYINCLHNFIPDIILCDFNFPSFDGPAAFQLREQIAPDTPFIIVSGVIGEEKSVELIKSGVTDYALKDKLFTLIPKITRALKDAKEQQYKKQIEKALALSEMRLSRAQQFAHVGSWAWHSPDSTISLSEEARSICGTEAGQFHTTFENWISAIHPEDRKFVNNQLQNARQLFHEFSISYRICGTNNTIKHIYLEGKPELDSTGRPDGLHGIIHDITETVLLEHALVKERHLRQIQITAAVLKAQENERAFVAKELNNNLNQILGAAKLYVELAKSDEDNRMLLLEKSSGYIVNVIEKIMEIYKRLTSPDIHKGLFNSIRILINDLIATNAIDIQFYEDDIREEYLDEHLQLTIFRIVQEQVNNIISHARATKATISLKIQGREIVLLITDNGQGNDLLKGVGGVGIKNIKSRAQIYNGSVMVVSYPGNGFELKVTMSLDEQARSLQEVNLTPTF